MEQESMTDAETLAETIIYLAEQRITKTGLAGAICAVCMEVDQILMAYMAEHREDNASCSAFPND